MKNVRIKNRPQLGDATKYIIHRAIDAAPLPARARRALKSCGGCQKRAEALNRADAAVTKAIASAANFIQGKPPTQQ